MIGSQLPSRLLAFAPEGLPSTKGSHSGSSPVRRRYLYRREWQNEPHFPCHHGQSRDRSNQDETPALEPSDGGILTPID